MDKEKIQTKISQLREKGRLLTNGYSENLVERAEELWETGQAVMFSYDDHGVKRLIFYACGQRPLKAVLQMAEGSEYVLEFLTRNEEANRTLFQEAGFCMLASMMRMSNPHCEDLFVKSPVLEFYDEGIGDLAGLPDIQEMNQKLWSVFDTRVSHLLAYDETIAAVEREEFSVHRSKTGEIDAILQAIIQPRRFYINQVYNGAEKKIIHAMLLKRLRKYVDEGGQYLYAWVEKSNIGSMKFHQKYGMKHDGMWNMVYIRE